MNELFRFYAIYSPPPVSPESQVSLDSGSDFQANVGTASTAAKARRESVRVLDDESETLPRDLAKTRTAVNELAQRLASNEGDEGPAPIGEWVRVAFNDSLENVVADPAFRRTTQRIKDLVAAHQVIARIGLEPKEAECGAPKPPPSRAHLPGCDTPTQPITRMLQREAPRPAPRPPLPQPPTASRSWTEVDGMMPELARQLRVRQAMERAVRGPISLAEARMTMKAPMTLSAIDRIIKLINDALTPPTVDEQLGDAQTKLADLTQLILRVSAACPFNTVFNGDGVVVMADAYINDLKYDFGDLLSALDAIPGGVVSATIGGPWIAYHGKLEAKAKFLVGTIHTLELQIAAQGIPAPAATTFEPTLLGGHMRFAGVAEVNVFHDHVIGYERGEVAHIENVLMGETRSRNYRTLTRREDETETATETTTTEEREIKTEERFELRTEADKVLKEELNVKAGFDLQASIGSTLKLGFNASVGYTRTKEETTKVATDFAKEVTNRAAKKVSETVRSVSKVRILRETEETVSHVLENTGVGKDNISGIYQWVEKLHETRHFTTGNISAIFDGIVLQPGQRLLGVPAKSPDGATAIVPPPNLDLTAADVHPWNYLALGAKFGASSLPAPPPLTAGISHSAAQGGGDAQAPGASAIDIVIVDGYYAGFANVTWYTGPDLSNDKPTSAHAEVSLGSTKLGGATAGKDDGERGAAQVMLAAERNAVPFAGLFYGGAGFQCAVSMTCVRGSEAYEAWQLQAFAAIDAAHSRAQQAYEERIARAALQNAYDSGPSPGRVDQVIREELKRCALGVLARQIAGRNLFQRVDDLYAAPNTAEIARLVLIYEHAFEWDQMSYVLYPYFWADGRNDGWNQHTSRDEQDPDLAEFLRAGAARVMVPVRTTFLQDVTDPATVSKNLAAILGETLTLDDLLDVKSPLTLSIESELGKPVKLEFVNKWTTRVPTELVILRDGKALPTWTWTDDGVGGSWSEP